MKNKVSVFFILALFGMLSCDDVAPKGTGGRPTGLNDKIFILKNELDSVTVKPKHRDWDVMRYWIVSQPDTTEYVISNWGDTTLQGEWYDISISYTKNHIKVKFSENPLEVKQAVIFLLNSNNRFESFKVSREE